MKKILLLLLLFAGMANAQIVNIPDANFKAKLITAGVDANSDGEIEQSEAAGITILDVAQAQIADMTGIEAFTGLSILVCFENQITTLDLSNSTNLSSVYCYSNLLTDLNITGLSSLQQLYCNDNQLTTLDAGGLTFLSNLNCSDNNISTLNINGCAGLTELKCAGNDLSSINVSESVNLTTLDCSSNSLSSINVTSLSNLINFNFSNNNLSSIDLSALTDLENLNCHDNQLSTIDLSGLINLISLQCGQNELSDLNVSAQIALEELHCFDNNLTMINVSGLVNLRELECSTNEISSLDLTGLNDLEHVGCADNNITVLDVNTFTDLKYLNVSGNPLSTLEVSGLINMLTLICPYTQLTELNVSTMVNLQVLNCRSNLLTELDLTNNTELFFLDCSINQLTSLEVTQLTELRSLLYGNNALPNVDFSNLPFLQELFLDSTGRTSLDVSNQPYLTTLFCGNNPISVVDVSNLTQLNTLSCGGPALTQLYMKNGRQEFLAMQMSPNLAIVCVDESQVTPVTTAVSSAAGSGATITTYCTFVPGGNYNTINGLSKFDLTNDGCNATDVSTSNLRINISDGILNEASFVNASSQYAFYTGVGNFTITPQLENPAYFVVSPETTTFNFPQLNNSTQTQDFCLTANGIHPDLEIVLIPRGAARPGFNAQYQVIYKNKGNQTLSGTINVIFDDVKSDFVAAGPSVDNQTPSSLIWNYADLRPFESREITFTLNINSPLEVPAVNAGDILDFTASINFATGDDTPADNISVLHQEVINSMDPNAKTCLEGDSISPSEIGNYLHYNIEFENLGNAEAVNVVVKDIIDTAMFDINSLQVLHSSHEMRATIHGNIIEFIFENINLAPAAGDPPVGGHGNVLFKIKTLNSLVEGDEVANTANIFFDYNAPIATNESRTAFEALNIPHNNIDQSIIMYPNPASNNVNIECSSMIKTIELFDIQGRILEMIIVNSNTKQLDISDKSTGIYFVKITSENGAKAEKLVKE
ncbi:MAG TPA: T9SS type A sorting domain-containing protein [Flavobacterium sp.]|jgi:uncharacterized repeat protein (TIGR01451 family)